MLHQTAQVRQQTLDYHRVARRSLRKMLDLLAAAKSVGGWVPSLWRFARRPRLHVYFDAAQTYMIRTVTDAGGVPGYFCHVMVRNHGHDVARKCRGRLTAVLQRDADGRTAPAPGFVAPVVLKWAHELDWNWNPRDIEHDVRRRLDLCYALQSAPQPAAILQPPGAFRGADNFPARALHRPYQSGCPERRRRGGQRHGGRFKTKRTACVTG